MNEGLLPARAGFHPVQLLLFLTEQTVLSSSELQPHPVQSHGYVSMATVSNRVHMGKHWKQKERERGGMMKKRKVSPWKSKPGITCWLRSSASTALPWSALAFPWQPHPLGSTGCLLGLPLANSQTAIINTDDATLPSVLGGCEHSELYTASGQMRCLRGWAVGSIKPVG